MTVENTRLEICNLSMDLYPQVKKLMDEVYAELGGAWPSHTIEYLITEFPEGQIGITDGDNLVGLALSVQVDYARFSNPHRGIRLGRRLYDARKELCRQYNLRAILAGGRIPNYLQHSDQLTPA